jgi:hypothetical protein
LPTAGSSYTLEIGDGLSQFTEFAGSEQVAEGDRRTKVVNLPESARFVRAWLVS